MAPKAQVTLPHRLEIPALRERLARAARQHGVTLRESPDGTHGELEKSVSFLGKVRASYELRPQEVEIQVHEAPAFLSSESIQRMLEEQLGRELAS